MTRTAQSQRRSPKYQLEAFGRSRQGGSRVRDLVGLVESCIFNRSQGWFWDWTSFARSGGWRGGLYDFLASFVGPLDDRSSLLRSRFDSLLKGHLLARFSRLFGNRFRACHCKFLNDHLFAGFGSYLEIHLRACLSNPLQGQIHAEWFWRWDIRCLGRLFYDSEARSSAANLSKAKLASC